MCQISKIVYTTTYYSDINSVHTFLQCGTIGILGGVNGDQAGNGEQGTGNGFVVYIYTKIYCDTII